MKTTQDKFFAMLLKKGEGGFPADAPDTEEQLVALAYEKLQHALLSAAHPPVSELIAYVLGESEEGERDTINLHLEECADCRDAFEELEAELKDVDSFLAGYTFPFEPQGGGE